MQIQVQCIQIGRPDAILRFDLRNAMFGSFVCRSNHSTHYTTPFLMSPQLLLYLQFNLFKKFHLTVMIRRLTFGTDSTIVAESVAGEKGRLLRDDVASVFCIVSDCGRIADHFIESILHFLVGEFDFFGDALVFEQSPHSYRWTFVLWQFDIVAVEIFNFVKNHNFADSGQLLALLPDNEFF